jgi:hypothetical protein
MRHDERYAELLARYNKESTQPDAARALTAPEVESILTETTETISGDDGEK